MRKYLLPVLFLFLNNCDLTPVSADSVWNDHLQVYFSTPGSKDVSRIQLAIMENIEHAHATIDIAIYELKNREIVDALIRADRRGVKVRMVGDINNAHNIGYKLLQGEGIEMRLGNPSRSMHNKYMIIDNEIVITGSANYTDTGFYYNNENIIYIRHKGVAAYFQGDFDTMFTRGLFGMDKAGKLFSNFSNNQFLITNKGKVSILEVFFTPYHVGRSALRPDTVVIDKIGRLKHSILFTVFAFTHEDMARAMIHAGARGLVVRGVFDSGWHLNSAYSVHDLFIQAQGWYPGLEVRFDGNEHSISGKPLSGAKCHNKFIIGDYGQEGAFLLTGSYNFSKSSSYMGNDENFVIIHDAGSIDMYYKNYLEQWRDAYSLTLDQGGDPADPGEVILSEVMWSGSVDNSKIHYPWDNFVELYNNSDHSINISGWQLEGTRATEALSYRLLMTLFPRDTVLDAGQVLLVAVSSNHAWSYSNVIIDPWLFLQDDYSQNTIRLVLKDIYGRVIDDAGTSYSLPFAGCYSPERGAYSMVRVMQPLFSGRMKTSWEHSSKANNNIHTGFNKYTCATPGTIGE